MKIIPCYRKSPQALMPNAVQVLCYGNDERLVETRIWVLNQAGFISTPTTEFQDFEHLLGTGQFDLVVLCHSLAERERDVALQCVRRVQPQAKILILTTVKRDTDKLGDSSLDVMEGPGALLKAIGSLVAGARGGAVVEAISG